MACNSSRHNNDNNVPQQMNNTCANYRIIDMPSRRHCRRRRRQRRPVLLLQKISTLPFAFEMHLAMLIH